MRELLLFESKQQYIYNKIKKLKANYDNTTHEGACIPV